MNSNKKAFTMIELVIVMSIIALLGGMLGFQVLAGKGSKTSEVKAKDLMNARNAMKNIVRELRNIERIQSVGENNIEYFSSEDGEKYNLVLEEGKLRKVGFANFDEKEIAELEKLNFNLKSGEKKDNIINISLMAGNVNLDTNLLIRSKQ